MLVLCPDPAEAAKCRTPIRTGHPGFRPGPSEEQRHQVTSSIDPAQLDRWFDRAVTATTAADAFTD